MHVHLRPKIDTKLDAERMRRCSQRFGCCEIKRILASMTTISYCTHKSVKLSEALTYNWKMKQPQEDAPFGINLANKTPPVRFAICVSGIFIFYFVYGLAQESLFTEWRKEGSACGWLLTFIQYAFYTIFTFLQRLSSGDVQRGSTPMAAYVVLAVFSVGTVGLSNASCDFLTYPTQVLFKSSKILPVMVCAGNDGTALLCSLF